MNRDDWKRLIRRAWDGCIAAHTAYPRLACGFWGLIAGLSLRHLVQLLTH